ncbi:MAG: hypothetical protein H7346_12490 [Burkholderiaceae bacterium]|nr:hypothetical protein [Burkholderiaceae bacterium]
MQEAAKAFGAANQVADNVVAGPTNQWIDKARQDADVVFSGAENICCGTAVHAASCTRDVARSLSLATHERYPGRCAVELTRFHGHIELLQ